MAANLSPGSVCSTRTIESTDDLIGQRRVLSITSSSPLRRSHLMWAPQPHPQLQHGLKLCPAIRARPEDKLENNNSPSAPPLPPFPISETGEALLRVYMPIAVVLGILMLIDAGYSGDWSRIGVLTKEQEVFLQGIVPLAAAGHTACAVVAAVLSARRGEKSWPLRGAKVLASGFVGVLEVALLPEKQRSE